jgi:hypothetical protein
VVNLVTFLLYHDCIRLVRTTLKQVWWCHQACYKLLTACSKLVTTTRNKQCEHNLSTLLKRFVTICLQTCNILCVFTCVAIHVTTVVTMLLQIWKQVVTRLLSSRYQDVFALLVPSCCDSSGTRYYLVTRLLTVTDLLQVILTRLIQAVRNKFGTSLLPSTC